MIVYTASVAAFDGQIGQAAYSASKGGVVGMTLPIARELARFGHSRDDDRARPFETPMMAQIPPRSQESLGKMVPFPPRLGRPAEFASLVRRDRAERDAQRRSDPPRRRDTHGAEIAYADASYSSRFYVTSAPAERARSRMLIAADQRERGRDHRDKKHEGPRRDRETEEHPGLLRAFAAAFQHLADHVGERHRLQHVVEPHAAGGNAALGLALDPHVPRGQRGADATIRGASAPRRRRRRTRPGL